MKRDMDWRTKLDPTLKEHFDTLIKNVHKEKKAYTKAKNPSQAQVWCAIAVLTKQISDMELHINKLEKQITPKENTKLKKTLEKF